MRKKSYLSLLIAIMFAVAPTNCFAADNTTETEAAVSNVITVFDSDTKKLEYNGCTLLNDYQGAPTAAVVLTYTNKTSTANTALTDYFVTVYQNGVSLKTTVLLDQQYAAAVSNSMVQVKDGASVTYCLPYLLNDLETPLEVEYSDSLMGENKNTMEITIAGVSAAQPQTEAVNWEEWYNELLQQYKVLEEKYNALVESQTE